MAPASLQIGRGLRQLMQQSAACTSAPSTSQVALRSISTSAPVLAAKPKPSAQKKKSVVKRKTTTSGPRGTGGKRKSGADSSSSISRTSEFFSNKPDFSSLTAFAADKLTPAAVGQHMAWSPKALAAFKSFGLPQELERELDVQPRPRTLVREKTLTVFKQLDETAKNHKSQRVLLTGAGGCGKSTLMAQSVSYALDEGWAVVYVPRTIDLINSSTPYAYSAADRVYVQPEATRTLLAAMLQVNEETFKKLATTEAGQLERAGKVEAGTTLDKVVRLGLEETASGSTRHQVFKLVLKTLGAQTEVPVLVAVDEVQALFRTSLYRDPDYEALEAYELGVPRALLSLVTGKTEGKRVAFLGATSSMQTEFAAPPEMLVALAGTGPDAEGAVCKVAHAYTKLHMEHLANAQAAKLETLEVGDKLTLDEAAKLFSQLKAERKMWSAAGDELFVAKCVESGSNARRFVRSLTSTLL